VCFRQSFIYRSNFTAYRNKPLRSHQVLHFVFNGLSEVDHPGFAAAIQSFQRPGLPRMRIQHGLLLPYTLNG
jgi:hypothetical protein